MSRFFGNKTTNNNQVQLDPETPSQAPQKQAQPQAPESIQVPDAQPTKKKNKGMMEFSAYPRLQMALRIYCSLAALSMSVLASYAVSIPRGCLDAYFYLISCWLVVLGIISILVEWRINRVRNLFAFLTYKTGRGFFYIFVGSLCTGITEIFGIVVGAAVIVGGVLTLAVSAFLRKKKKKMGLATQEMQPVQD